MFVKVSKNTEVRILRVRKMFGNRRIKSVIIDDTFILNIMITAIEKTKCLVKIKQIILYIIIEIVFSMYQYILLDFWD